MNKIYFLIAKRLLKLNNGNQNIANINISYNNNKEISGIYYINPNNIFSNYRTFYNNNVRDHYCIYLIGNTCTISKSNIILIIVFQIIEQYILLIQ